MLGKRFRSDKAGIAVEFAIVAPILLMLIVATVDIGLALSDYMKLTSAIRTSFDYALVKKDDDLAGIENRVKANAGSATVSAAATCTCDGAAMASCSVTCAGTMSKFITVTASQQYTPLFDWPFLPLEPGQDYMLIDIVGEFQVE